MLKQLVKKQGWWRCDEMNPIIKSTLVLQWATGMAMDEKRLQKKHNVEKTRELLSQGQPISEIAKQLSVKEGTIKNYIKEIRGSVAKQKEVEKVEEKPKISLREFIECLIKLPVYCLILFLLTIALAVAKVLKLIGLWKR